MARHGLALTLDRWLPGPAARLPYGLSQLSAAWLTRALQSRFPGAEIADFEALDAHSGTTTRARVRVRYAAAGTGPPPPDLIFVKIAPEAPAQRLFASIFGLGRNEVAVYQTLWEELPVRVPELYGSGCTGGGRRFALLLEDLTPSGARFARIGERASAEDAERVVGCLARLHAAYWDSPRLHSDLAFLPRLETRQAGLPWERFFSGLMLKRAKQFFAAELPPEYTAAIDLLVAERNGLEELWAMGPRTLVHGDCHIGNLFFEGEEVGFLDWQVASCAPGLRDFSYFLCNSLASELRLAHERDLLTHYLGQLEALGVKAPSFEEAWVQHRSFALYAFLAAAFTAGTGEGLQPREVVLAGVRRGTQALIELETLPLLEARLAAGPIGS